MGRVWRARDEILDREVAIKEIVLPAEFTVADRDAAQRRTLREARAAARLSHPNVVRVYDVLEADDRTWIVMEYVPSCSLQQAIKADGPLEPRRTAHIGLEVLAGLDAAHRAGVRHRDVKPANVLLAHDGRVVLTDFGIATIEGDSLVTRSGLVLGSPAYMSPERARYGTAGVASDMWSLGATLYAAVEGRSPYQRRSAIETLTALAGDEPDPPHRAGVLKPVLDGLLRKDPADRTDVGETQRRLRTAATGERVPDRRWPRSVGRSHPASAVTAARQEPPSGSAAADAVVAASAPVVPLPRVAEPPSRVTEPAASVAAVDAANASTAHPHMESLPDLPSPATQSPVGMSTDPAADGDAAMPNRSGTGQARRRTGLATAAILALAVTTVIWLAIRQDPSSSARSDPGQTAATTAAPAAPVGPGPATPSSAGGDTSNSAGGRSPATTGGAGLDQSGGTSGASGGTSGNQRSDGAQRPALPAGWRDYRDSTGFTVYVPTGWTRSRDGSIVYFRDPKTGRVLGIDQTNRPKSDPVADWRGQSSYRVARGDFPGYREVHIVAVKYGLKAADWEFTFNGRVRQHVNNRGFVVSESKAYGIYWQTKDTDWAAARSDLQLVSIASALRRADDEP
jgi:hypothetical protein